VAKERFLTKVTIDQEAQNKNKGMFFAGNYGALERHEIPPGKMLFVDHGLFFAAHELTRISMGLVGGICGCTCGGEGFVMKFFGPCVVYTKSRDPSRLFERGRENNRQKKQSGGASAGGMSVGVGAR